MRRAQPKRPGRKIATAQAPPLDPAVAHNLLTAYAAAFHEWEAVVGYSPRTIRHQRFALARFISWCDERALQRPHDITRPILERYQRHVYHYRKHNGAPLTVAAQLGLILPLQAWFKWLTKQNHILYNPAADLDLPRKPKALPKGLLSIAQIDTVLATCDMTTAAGVRMRAILETLYSSGMRRFELAGLKLFDVDVERGAVMIRQGKGNQDRLIPLGARACAWLGKYLDEVRPELATSADDYMLFLDDNGQRFEPGRLGDRVKCQLLAAGITQPGSCHLFRHACATHMLENGADIRFIQALLGHSKLDTTQIYAQVSIAKLKEIHNATHPARLERSQGTIDGEMIEDTSAVRAALLAAIESEEDDRDSHDMRDAGDGAGGCAGSH